MDNRERGQVCKTAETCSLCLTDEMDEVNLGDLYKIGDMTVHYFCVLLSHRAEQRGKDEDGINGFLYLDIRKEIDRCSSVVCNYCDKKGASVQCGSSKCSVKFHLPCGLKFNALSLFYEDFPSYCRQHRSKQRIPKNVMREAQQNIPICTVCLLSVDIKDTYDVIWASCCKKNWYHRLCLSRLALSTGSLFKCPICSDTDIFVKSMLELGLYIPERDAAWEYEPNAFNDLQFRYNRCDAEPCLARGGRTVDVCGGNWEILICSTCGSKGTHVRCGNLKFHATTWECGDCANVGNLNGSDEEQTPSVPKRKTTRPRTKRRSKSWARGVLKPKKRKLEDRGKKHEGNITEAVSSSSLTFISPSAETTGTDLDESSESLDFIEVDDISPKYKIMSVRSVSRRAFNATNDDPEEEASQHDSADDSHIDMEQRKNDKNKYIRVEGVLYKKVDEDSILSKPTNSKIDNRADRPIIRSDVLINADEKEATTVDIVKPTKSNQPPELLLKCDNSKFEVLASCRSSQWFVSSSTVDSSEILLKPHIERNVEKVTTSHSIQTPVTSTVTSEICDSESVSSKHVMRTQSTQTINQTETSQWKQSSNTKGSTQKSMKTQSTQTIDQTETSQWKQSSNKKQSFQKQLKTQLTQTIDQTETSQWKQSSNKKQPSQKQLETQLTQTIDQTETSQWKHSSNKKQPSQKQLETQLTQTIDQTETSQWKQSSNKKQPSQKQLKTQLTQTIDQTETSQWKQSSNKKQPSQKQLETQLTQTIDQTETSQWKQSSNKKQSSQKQLKTQIIDQTETSHRKQSRERSKLSSQKADDRSADSPQLIQSSSEDDIEIIAKDSNDSPRVAPPLQDVGCSTSSTTNVQKQPMSKQNNISATMLLNRLFANPSISATSFKSKSITNEKKTGEEPKGVQKKSRGNSVDDDDIIIIEEKQQSAPAVTEPGMCFPQNNEIILLD